MKPPVICCCAALVCLAASCAPNRPELPADQPVKIRLHQQTPYDGINASGSNEGSPLPPTSEGSWKF